MASWVSCKSVPSASMKPMWEGEAEGWSFCAEDAAAAQSKPDREVRVRLSAPEPGYVATPIFLVHAGLELFKERQAIAERLGPGGVFTAGTLLWGTSYLKRLQSAGIGLEVVSDTHNP